MNTISCTVLSFTCCLFLSACTHENKKKQDAEHATLMDTVYRSAALGDTTDINEYDEGDDNEFNVAADMYGMLEYLRHPISDEYYMVKGCWEHDKTHAALWKARFDIFETLKIGGTNTAFYLCYKYRNPAYIAKILQSSLPELERRWKRNPRDAGKYHALIRALLSYNKKIRSVKDWEERFKKLLNESSNSLHDERVFHTAGFPASRDSCMLKPSNREHSLESWFYGFWVRRYRDHLFELSEMALKRFDAMLANKEQGNDTLGFKAFIEGEDPEAEYAKIKQEEQKNRFAQLRRTYIKSDTYGWDGPIYAGYDAFDECSGSLLINQNCRLDDAYAAQNQWFDTIFYRESFGLEPEMELTGISPDGTLKTIALTELYCASGECHADWWVVGFNEKGAPAKDDASAVEDEVKQENSGRRPVWFAAFPPSVVSLADSVRRFAIMSRDSNYTPPATEITVPDSISNHWSIVYTVDSATGIYLQLFRFETEDEQGYQFGDNYMRMKNTRYSDRYGPWIPLSTEGHGMYPVYLIKNKGMVRILCASSEGIGDPSYETRMFFKVDGNILVPGRKFSAGGQPCS